MIYNITFHNCHVAYRLRYLITKLNLDIQYESIRHAYGRKYIVNNGQTLMYNSNRRVTVMTIVMAKESGRLICTFTVAQSKKSKIRATFSSGDVFFGRRFLRATFSSGDVFFGRHFLRLMYLVYILELVRRKISLEACRSMLSMADGDRSGKLDYNEFRGLWKTILLWKDTFKTYDKASRGKMKAIELQDALSKLGFNITTTALSAIIVRYANKRGVVTLDDYIQICCTIKSCFGTKFSSLSFVFFFYRHSYR